MRVLKEEAGWGRSHWTSFICLRRRWSRHGFQCLFTKVWDALLPFCISFHLNDVSQAERFYFHSRRKWRQCHNSHIYAKIKMLNYVLINSGHDIQHSSASCEVKARSLFWFCLFLYLEWKTRRYRGFVSRFQNVSRVLFFLILRIASDCSPPVDEGPLSLSEVLSILHGPAHCPGFPVNSG